jgi:hypothetical protein
MTYKIKSKKLKEKKNMDLDVGNSFFLAEKDNEPFIPKGMEELHKESITKRKHYPYGDD